MGNPGAASVPGVRGRRPLERRGKAVGPEPAARSAPALPSIVHRPLLMTLSLADVARIAHLSRIEVDAVEAEEMRAKLDAILTLINELQAIDTEGVVPMAHAQDVMLPLREDEVTETDHHVLYQSVAPALEDGLYLVPKVID